MGYSGKKQTGRVEDITKKNPGFFLLNPWKFQTKQSSIPGNSTKLC